MEKPKVNLESTLPPRIVCAANRNSRGDIVLGIRHFDRFMLDNIQRYRAACTLVDSLDKHVACDFYEQGFVDQQGNFLTRTEAWKIAKANNQIIRRVGGDSIDGGTLFSENLY